MIGVVLFAQLAVSGFACQGTTMLPAAAMPLAGHGAPDGHDAGRGGGAHAAALHHAGLQAQAGIDAAIADEHCGSATIDTPNLCYEHCRDGVSTPGHQASAPDFGFALVGGLPLVPDDPALPLGDFAPVRFGIEPGTPPPHAILHCCLRA